MEYEHIVHSFEPIFDSSSQILILGTLPSVKSRETNFYYGHKQNRFWKVLAALFQEPIPETIDEKKHLLLRHHIAIWDVIQSCDIKGSSDSSIKNVEPVFLRNHPNARILPRIFFQNLPRTVRRAVVHKDNLDLAHRLIQNGIRAGAQKPFAVVNRHNQTDHLFFPL